MKPYVIALALVAVGGLLMGLESELLDAPSMLVLVLLPIAASAYLGGLGPGLFATLVGVLIGAYLLAPGDDFAEQTAHDLIRLSLTGLVGAFISLLSGRLRRLSEQALAHSAQAQREAELALRESEARFRALFEGAGDGIFISDASGHYVDVNAQGVILLGYERDEILGCTIMDIVAEHERPRVPVDLAAVVEGTPHLAEWQFLRKDGSTLDGEVNARLLPDGRVIGIVRDVSEHKRLEAHLRAQTEELQTVMELAPVGLWVARDPQCHCIVGNRVANALFRVRPGVNVSQSPAPGKHTLRLQIFDANGRALAPDDLPMQAAAARGEPVRDVEFDVVHGDGMRQTLYGSALPLHDERGRVRGAVGAFMDITERKEIERALRASEERLRLAKAAAGLGIYDRDLQTGALQWDDRVRELWGVGAEEPLSYETFMSGLHPEDRAPTEAAIARALDASGDGLYQAQYRVIHRLDRTTRWVHAMGQMLFSGGRAVRSVGTVQDITERKRLEQMKTEFVSVVNHELRTPLTSILGALGLIEGGVTGALPGAVKSMVAIAHRNAKRLALLVNDILAIDKLESGKMEFRLKSLDLIALAKDALNAHRPFAEQWGVALTLDTALPEAWLEADPDRLMQVLTNLISNACKFSPQGETVTLRVARVAAAVRLEVADHGPGIPEHFKGRIFEKFAQADSTDARAKGGTGLGLAISKAIIERLGGRIGFESEAVHGAIFWVELPAT